MARTRGNTGFGTLVKLSDGGTASTLAVGSGVSGIDLIAQEAGVAGDSIQFEIDTAAASSVIVVSVVGTDITVVPVGAIGVPTSTAKEIVEALNADDEVWDLIRATLQGDGSGAVATFAQAPLANGVDEVFTTVAEVKDINPGSFTSEIADATHNESPGAYREKLVTFLDAGQLTFSMNFLVDNPNHKNLFAVYETRERSNFRIHWTDILNTVWEIEGIITGISPAVPMADMITADVTIDITGQVLRDV